MNFFPLANWTCVNFSLGSGRVHESFLEQVCLQDLFFFKIAYASPLKVKWSPLKTVKVQILSRFAPRFLSQLGVAPTLSWYCLHWRRGKNLCSFYNVSCNASSPHAHALKLQLVVGRALKNHKNHRCCNKIHLCELALTEQKSVVRFKNIFESLLQWACSNQAEWLQLVAKEITVEIAGGNT